MQRIKLLQACMVALWALPGGVSAAPAQVTSPGRPEVASQDTVTISLREAHGLALAENREFLAEQQALAIARGQLTRARVYAFNPELEFQAPGVGDRGAIREYEASLSQEVEWAGQRGLRIRAARLGLDRAESVARDAARNTLAEVSMAFYTVLAADQRLAVARELLQLNEQLLAATRIQAREGEISSMEANLAEIEAGRGRARVLTALRVATSSRLELQRLIGIAPDREIRLLDEVPRAPDPAALNLDSLVALALAHRPDLESQTRAMDQAEALTRLARREAIPNLSIGVFVEREEQAYGAIGGQGGPGGGTVLESPRVGLGVRVPVPLFDRNQGVIAERAAQTEQARLFRQATELAVRTQVTNAVRAYRTASEEARVFERDVLQPARANQRLLETAYRAGKVGLPTLMLLRNQLLDAELGYGEAWLAARRALVALQASTATLETDLNQNPSGHR